MNDVLSDVLNTLELESSVYFRAELSSPFSIAVPQNENVIRFHLVNEGGCLISAGTDSPVRFEPGDLIMVPHGLSHVLTDSPEHAARPLEDVLDASSFDGDGPLVYGGGGERTTLVCGHFAFDPAVTHPFIETLPRLLHLKRADGADYGWIEQMLAFTEQESRTKSTGWQGVVERLSQILFVYVLRAHMEREPETSGALGALVDPQLSEVLQAIHTYPATDWSLETLAQKAGMSRSAFVRKFNQACGMAPMRYLTQWRMSRARYMLAHSESSVGEISAEVGYASESAFNRAFKEQFDEPPATFRRQLREARS